MGLPRYPRQAQPDGLGQTSPSERYKKREQRWWNAIGNLIVTIIPWR